MYIICIIEKGDKKCVIHFLSFNFYCPLSLPLCGNERWLNFHTRLIRPR